MWPSDAIWRLRSTLAQVMTWCLMAPSHYLNQCWLLISEILWYSLESNFTARARAAIWYNESFIFLSFLYIWNNYLISKRPMSWYFCFTLNNFNDIRNSCENWNWKLIEAETKWTPFLRRHFQVHFLEWKCLNSDSGDKPLSEPMMVSLLTHICVTRPQWVKGTMK